MDGESHWLSSSLRVRPVHATLAIARELAPTLGITRTTETTRLDRIGVPVFASIRPKAHPSSLCVSAGKGFTRPEAEVGALMEAIELAWAEVERAQVEWIRTTGHHVLDGGDALHRLCPRRDCMIDLDAPIDCVPAFDLRTNERLLVPAELVVYPMPRDRGGALYFGSDGNGLCSGNRVDEAVVHGLAEVIERDVMAFHNIHDQSRRVIESTLPERVRVLLDQLRPLGFAVHVRYLPNAFDFPVVMAVVIEDGVASGIHVGYGANASRDIAVARAVCEAIQCRLTVIHGGRDDLPGFMQQLASLSPEVRDALHRRLGGQVADATKPIDFVELPDHSARITDIASATQVLLEVLARGGFREALYVRLTPTDYPIAVIRVLVPGLEVYTGPIRRMGRRLKERHETYAMSDVRRTDAGKG